MYRHVVTCLCAAVVLSICAPQARADAGSPLEAAITSARVASSCPPLHPDPLVEQAASMANQQTSDYFSHRSAAVPFTDPMPALKAIGFSGTKAMLLSGNGLNASNALEGLMLQWSARKPDCSWSLVGVRTLTDDTGLNLASVFLAAS